MLAAMELLSQLWLHIAYIKLKCVKSQASPDPRPLSSQASPDPCPLSSQASPPLILTFVQKVILLLIYRNIIFLIMFGNLHLLFY